MCEAPFWRANRREGVWGGERVDGELKWGVGLGFRVYVIFPTVGKFGYYVM
jgi:hypothetical protein